MLMHKLTNYWGVRSTIYLDRKLLGRSPRYGFYLISHFVGKALLVPLIHGLRSGTAIPLVFSLKAVFEMTIKRERIRTETSIDVPKLLRAVNGARLESIQRATSS